MFCKDFSLDPLGWLGCQRENVSGGSVAEIFINFIILVVDDGPPIWNCRRVDAEKIRQLPLEARFSTCLIVWRAYAEKNATLFIGKSNHNCSSLASFLSPPSTIFFVRSDLMGKSTICANLDVEINFTMIFLCFLVRRR